MSIYEILGPSAVPTLICLVVGLVMLVLEMFTPGVGISGAVGVLALIAVGVMQIGWGSPKIGLLIVAIVLILVLLMLLWFIRSFQKGRLSKSRIVLHDSIDADSAPVTANEKTEFTGKRGVSITPLRPAGMAEIDGVRMNVSTSGAFIAAGKPIEVTGANGFDVLVKEICE